MNLSLNSLRLISISLEDRLRLAKKNAAHPNPDAAAFWPAEVKQLEKLQAFIKSEIAHAELECDP